jgi:hypothetical protein
VDFNKNQHSRSTNNAVCRTLLVDDIKLPLCVCRNRACIPKVKNPLVKICVLYHVAKDLQFCFYVTCTCDETWSEAGFAIASVLLGMWRILLQKARLSNLDFRFHKNYPRQFSLWLSYHHEDGYVSHRTAIGFRLSAVARPHRYISLPSALYSSDSTRPAGGKTPSLL